MNIDDLSSARPIPDDKDLRLLGELINNVSIPLANAAWNAQMSQAEAAARLVSMAEHGLPLRLVADGDRQALWQLAQAGPAPLTGGAGGESDAPPPVPPHEQATAGAIPLGEPPFGTPEPESASQPEALSQREAPEPAATPEADGTAAPEPAAVPEPAASVTSSEPRWSEQPVTGPAGEQLAVTILDVVDPGNDLVAAAGQQLNPGQRAVLVRSSVSNVGQVDYPAAGDANLVLETDQHVLLGRSGVVLDSHPGFDPATAAGQVSTGWAIFLVSADIHLTGLKWCIRPDMPQTILSWPIAP